MSAKPYKYLALGDSYTIGTGVPLDKNFPYQVSIKIQNRGFKIDDPVIIAEQGWTSLNLLQALEKNPLSDPFDLVTLLIGVNDQYNGIKLDYYRDNFTTLLEKSIQFAGGSTAKVIVLSIPDWSVTPHVESFNREDIRKEINQFNQLNKSLTRAQGIAYQDITWVSHQAADNKSLLVGDGLHPSADMYNIWADLILPTALDIILK